MFAARKNRDLKSAKSGATTTNLNSAENQLSGRQSGENIMTSSRVNYDTLKS